MSYTKQVEILKVLCSADGNPRLRAYINLLNNLRGRSGINSIPSGVSIIALIKMPNTHENAPFVIRRLGNLFIESFDVKAKYAGDGDAISHCLKVAHENGLNVKESDVMDLLFSKDKEISDIGVELAIILMTEMQADLRGLLTEFLASKTKRGDKNSASVKIYLQSMYYFMQPMNLGSDKIQEKDDVYKNMILVYFTETVIGLVGLDAFVAILHNSRGAIKMKGLKGIDDVLGVSIKDAAHPTNLSLYSEDGSSATDNLNNFIFSRFEYISNCIRHAYEGELNKAYAVLEKSLDVKIGTKIIGENYYNYDNYGSYMKTSAAFIPCTAYLLATMLFVGIREKMPIEKAA